MKQSTFIEVLHSFPQILGLEVASHPANFSLTEGHKKIKLVPIGGSLSLVNETLRKIIA